MNLNQVTLIGRLTRAVELKTTPSGAKVATISLATSHKFKDKKTEAWTEETDYHTLVAWGKMAETLAQYTVKGQEMFFQGRLRTRKWTDKNQQTRYSTEVMINEWSFGSKPGGAKGAPAKSPADVSSDFMASQDTDMPVIQQEQDINVEDIPF